MENKTPIIRMDGLGKAFTGSQGTVRALEDISLEIMPGEIFGIIGLSGAGKSTLVRCMNYLEVPSSICWPRGQSWEISVSPWRSQGLPEKKQRPGPGNF